jgi:hypothetical protein
MVMRTRMFLLLAAAFFIVVGVAAAIGGGGLEWAIPVAILGLIVLAYALVNKGLEQRELSRHGGDENEALRDASEGGLPKAHVVGDEHTALGDTPEVHGEISPHDFPKGAPERQAAERMAEERESGEETTTGHEDPSEREGRAERVTPSAENHERQGT